MRHLTEREAYVAAWNNRGLIGYAMKRLPSSRLPQDDLFAAGLEAMKEAVHTFDPKKGKVSTHLTNAAYRGMLIAIQGNGWLRVPKDIAWKTHEWNRGRLDIERAHPRMRENITKAAHALGLDCVGSNKAHAPVHLMGSDEDFVEEIAWQEAKEVWLARAWGAVSEKEQRIIRLFYGIGGEPLMLKQIAEQYGVTHQRIHQIIDVALEKMRRALKHAA